MPASTRAVQQPDEAELARRAARGDGEAFAQLYERYSDRERENAPPVDAPAVDRVRGRMLTY